MSPSSNKLSNVLVYVFTYFAYAFSSRALQNSFLCLEWQKIRFFSAPLVGNLNGEGIDWYWYNRYEVTYKEIMILFIIYGTHMSNSRTRAYWKDGGHYEYQDIKKKLHWLINRQAHFNKNIPLLLRNKVQRKTLWYLKLTCSLMKLRNKCTCSVYAETIL